MNEDLVSQIVKAVLKRLSDEDSAKESLFKTEQGFGDMPLIPVEVSGKHVHFSEAHFKELFGNGAKLENLRDISQPGQFLSKTRVRLIGPKGAIDRVAVLGPFRKETQVEVSLTDAAALGIEAPIRQSGDIAGGADIHIQAEGKMLFVPSCVIVAARHLHMSKADAERFNAANGQLVDILVEGTRPLVLRDVLVRAGDTCALGLHIDFDEANAAGVKGKAFCRILSQVSPREIRQEPVKQSGYVLETLLLTEKTVEALYRQGIREITAKNKAIVTALASDALKKRGISFRRDG